MKIKIKIIYAVTIIMIKFIAIYKNYSLKRKALLIQLGGLS